MNSPFQLGLNWDDCWDDLKGLLGAERWVKRRLISVKQLCYTPKAEAILILKHFLPFRNPILRIFVIWSEPRMVKILVVPAAPRMNLTSSTGS